jgi:GT2 family glycosyltransferase
VDVTVVVATYGDGKWPRLALDRAIPSVDALGVHWVHCHADTLHDARNGALEMVDTEWVCYLDADDELEPGYFDAMAAGTADVRAPSVRYVLHTGRSREPYIPKVAGHHHTCNAECLVYGNWLVVGSLIRRHHVIELGGWRDFDWSEDWDLWLRAHLAGLSIEGLPDAVYRAHVRPDSRNRGATQAERERSHRAIAEANGVLV